FTTPRSALVSSGGGATAGSPGSCCGTPACDGRSSALSESDAPTGHVPARAADGQDGGAGGETRPAAEMRGDAAERRRAIPRLGPGRDRCVEHGGVDALVRGRARVPVATGDARGTPRGAQPGRPGSIVEH